MIEQISEKRFLSHCLSTVRKHLVATISSKDATRYVDKLLLQLLHKKVDNVCANFRRATRVRKSYTSRKMLQLSSYSFSFEKVGFDTAEKEPTVCYRICSSPDFGTQT